MSCTIFGSQTVNLNFILTGVNFIRWSTSCNKNYTKLTRKTNKLIVFKIHNNNLAKFCSLIINIPNRMDLKVDHQIYYLVKLLIIFS